MFSKKGNIELFEWLCSLKEINVEHWKTTIFNLAKQYNNINIINVLSEKYKCKM